MVRIQYERGCPLFLPLITDYLRPFINLYYPPFLVPLTLARLAAFSALTCAGVLRALEGRTGLLLTGPQLLPLLLKLLNS